MKRGRYMGFKKFHSRKKCNPRYKKETVEDILDFNNKKFSDRQKKMLYELYLENLKDGLKPKEAMDKAYQIVNCFKI